MLGVPFTKVYKWNWEKRKKENRNRMALSSAIARFYPQGASPQQVFEGATERDAPIRTLDETVSENG